METALAVQRTPDVIAAEINNIKDQTRTMLLVNSIEIGRRLVEAKALMPHGEWGKWLENSVDYSQSTANNLMRIYEEYGANQQSLFGTEVKSQALGKLSYSKAVALLSLPAEEREQFVEEHDVEQMSTRELQKAIKERDQALQELQRAQAQAEEAKLAQAALEQAKEESQLTISQLQKSIAELETKLAQAQESDNDEEVQRLQQSLNSVQEQLANSRQQVQELERQLKERPIETTAAPVVEKVPEEVERELQELRKSKKSAVVTRFSVYFDELVKGFNNLLEALGEMQQEDPEVHERYRKAVTALIDKMAARL